MNSQRTPRALQAGTKKARRFDGSRQRLKPSLNSLWPVVFVCSTVAVVVLSQADGVPHGAEQVLRMDSRTCTDSMQRLRRAASIHNAAAPLHTFQHVLHIHVAVRSFSIVPTCCVAGALASAARQPGVEKVRVVATISGLSWYALVSTTCPRSHGTVTSPATATAKGLS